VVRRYEQALSDILGSVVAKPLQEMLPLLQANGRYCASDISAPIAVPPTDNSAMDGYAVRVKDIVINKPVRVAQRIAAGDNAIPLEANSVARIFTGAMLPSNADAVIIQENASFDSGASLVRFSKTVDIGANIRKAGEDVACASQVIAKGELIDAAKIGLLASLGIAQLACFKPVRVAFFSTGDELQEPGEALKDGKIFNSNRYALLSALATVGVEVVDLGICPDSADTTREMLVQASEQADCIITTGGMSVGDEDYVYEQANLLGNIDFWKIAIKPGKPLAFGRIGGAHFFGLPGNPVSSFLTFYVFVLPWLRKRSGAINATHEMRRAGAQFNYANKGRRLEFLRGKLQGEAGGEIQVSLYPRQGSGIFSSIDFANVLVPVQPGVSIHAGDQVEVMDFRLLP